jgi:hypothetical protein
MVREKVMGVDTRASCKGDRWTKKDFHEMLDRTPEVTSSVRKDLLQAASKTPFLRG